MTQPSVPTLRTLAVESWQEVTNLDSKGWKTLKGIALPGRLAKAWTRGNRDEGYPPIRVYLVASAVYFLVGTHPSLAALTEGTVRELIAEDAVSGLSVPALRATVERQITSWVAFLRFLSLVPVGLAMAAVAPRGPRVAPGLVLAMHYFTVAFLLSAMMSVGWWVVGSGLTPDVAADVTTPLLLLERGLVAVWLVLAMRHVHGLAWGGALWRGLMITCLDLFLLMILFGVAAGGMGAYLSL
ncbi:MAG: DUF3667 domain-containing protein [Gemmatimonadales bacterium]|nr:MAG: DUF3667 domain-containing protein [Gemmatimonadales bacterium]